MCRLLVLLPLAAAVGCGYGFNPTRSGPAPKRSIEPLLQTKASQKKADASPDQAAAQAAMELLGAKSKELFDALKAEAQPSDVRTLAGDLAATMKGHDLRPAPADFKGAWSRHRKAWLQLQAALKPQADAYPDSEFTDALLGLFKNDPNRGKSLGGDVVDAVAAITKSHADLYSAAEAVGLEVEK